MARPIINFDAGNVSEYLQTLIGSHMVSRADIVREYMGKNVPDMAVVFVYLGSRQLADDNPLGLSEESLNRYFEEGRAISSYIDTELADDHPNDKRFLLRHMELLCYRYVLNRTTATGFGHDLIFSREPIAEHYPKFDNSLYVPPLTGHWAIATKSAARD